MFTKATISFVLAATLVSGLPAAAPTTTHTFSGGPGPVSLPGTLSIVPSSSLPQTTHTFSGGPGPVSLHSSVPTNVTTVYPITNTFSIPTLPIPTTNSTVSTNPGGPISLLPTGSPSTNPGGPISLLPTSSPSTNPGGPISLLPTSVPPTFPGDSVSSLPTESVHHHHHSPDDSHSVTPSGIPSGTPIVPTSSVLTLPTSLPIIPSIVPFPLDEARKLL